MKRPTQTFIEYLMSGFKNVIILREEGVFESFYLSFYSHQY